MADVTNEQLLQAYNDLLNAYENITAIKPSGLPDLYKNPTIFWDGKENLTTTSPSYQQIIPVGTATKALYGLWNYRFGATFTNALLPLASLPEALPANFIKFKIPSTSLENGTFFIKSWEADSWGYGIKHCWLCNPVTELPSQYLGSNCCDKTSDVGNSYQISPTNNCALEERYHQWLGFNFSAEQIQGATALDGTVSFAVCSTATWHISGYAIAERNFSAHITNGKILTDGYYGYSGNRPVGNAMLNQIYLHHLTLNTTLNELRVPYEAAESGLRLGFIDFSPYYNNEPQFFGVASFFEFKKISTNAASSYAQLVKKSINNNTTCYETELSAEEVAQNTIVVNGLKLLRIKVVVPNNSRHTLFACFYTEGV